MTYEYQENGKRLGSTRDYKITFFLGGEGIKQEQIDGKFSRDDFSYLSAVLGGVVI